MSAIPCEGLPGGSSDVVVSGSLSFDFRQNLVEGGHHPVGVAEFLGFPLRWEHCRASLAGLSYAREEAAQATTEKATTNVFRNITVRSPLPETLPAWQDLCQLPIQGSCQAAP